MLRRTGIPALSQSRDVGRETLLCLVRNDFAALVLDVRIRGWNGIKAALVKQQALAARADPVS